MYDNAVMTAGVIDTDSDDYVVSVLREMSRISKSFGNDKMTAEDIDSEISAYRAGHYGVFQKIPPSCINIFPCIGERPHRQQADTSPNAGAMKTSPPYCRGDLGG